MTNPYQAGFAAAVTLAETKDHFCANTAVVELNYEDESAWRRAYQGIGTQGGFGYARLTSTTCEFDFAGVTVRFKWDGIKRPQIRERDRTELTSETRQRMIEDYKRQCNAPSAASHSAAEKREQFMADVAEIKPSMRKAIDDTVASVRAVSEILGEVTRQLQRLNALKGA